MKRLATTLALLVTLLSAPAVAQTACQPGTYAAPDGDFVVLVPLPSIPAPGLRYLFRDGRRGATSDADAPLLCGTGEVSVQARAWKPVAFRETPTTFDSVGTKMSGVLIEPPTIDPKRPLVVMVHGSERTSPIGGVYGYAMAAQGIAVFVYDKRGTGGSEGQYTQNFELLAADAAHALDQARSMTTGRVGRAGFFGGSQGGWVAPRAATLTKADFVAVGFGLVASPIEEDREAPIETTRGALLGLAKDGKPVDVYLFPDTDHGMFEYRTNADGSRSGTRITDGYLKLLGDWVKGAASGPYGRAEHLTKSVSPR